MKHKNLILLFVLLTWGLSEVEAQSNTLSSGGNATGSEGSVSYSLGQIDYIQAIGSGGTANQGVQQPYEIYILGANDPPHINLEISAYPNPTVGHITLHVGTLLTEELYYQLYDLHGRILNRGTIQKQSTNIPMEELASAVYILRVNTIASHLKSFKIIKK